MLQIVPVARLEAFKALKLSKTECFRAIKELIELPELVSEPCEARYIKHVPENLFKLFPFFKYQQPILCLGPKTLQSVEFFGP